MGEHFDQLLGVGGNSSLGCSSEKLPQEDVCVVPQLCPPGSSIHGIFRTRILEWVATSFPTVRDLPNSGIKQLIWMQDVRLLHLLR